MVAPSGNRGRPNRGRDSDLPEGFDNNVVEIKRCTKVVKGGKRMRFSAWAVIGNRNGIVGVGHGKAREVPMAISKAVRNAKKHLFPVAVRKNTIPHQILSKSGATTVLLRPAAPGTGVVAGATVRGIVELAGIHNILSKVMGSTNPVNVAKATMQALQDLRTKSDMEQLRGVKIG
jgi:small subunit ribosomal protein S5